MKRGAPAATCWPDAVDEARRFYNQPVRKQGTLNARGFDEAAELVATKLQHFCSYFSQRVQVTDLLSKKVILADHEKLRMRYQTVFRESGEELQMAVVSRAVFLPRDANGGGSSSTVMVLDLERHSSLVTPIGANLDGALGLRGPRRQDLWALYKVRGGVIESMWLTPAGGQMTGQTGALAFAALKASPREWPAFESLLVAALGDGFATLTGPLHTARVGKFEMQGRRPTMEDQIAVEVLPAAHIARPALSTVQFLGLYDGHGGAACAHYAASELHTCLKSSSAFLGGDVCTGLSEAFAACEAGFLADSQSASGSCALVAVLGSGRLHLAHIGDSRAVLCQRGVVGDGEDVAGFVAVPLTDDHKPDSPEEKARIESIGGMVVIGGRCARVTHPSTSMMLATSRSFGDRNFKESWKDVAMAMEARLRAEAVARALEAPPSGEAAEAQGGSLVDLPAYVSVHADEVQPLLSPVPCVAERTLVPGDEFVILACDGVWDVLTDTQACDSVRAALAQPHATPEEAARKLAGDAYNAGSEDNISVLVAVLSEELV